MPNYKKTPEQIAAAKALYHSTNVKAKCVAAALSNSKLDSFAYEFLPHLFDSYKNRYVSSLVGRENEQIKFRKYNDSIYLELSATWIRKNYGAKSYEAFCKLFKMVQPGGRSIETGESWQTLWVMNEEAYSFSIHQRMVFRLKGKVTSADVWALLENMTAFKRAATEHKIVTLRNGRSQVVGDRATKDFHPTTFFKNVSVKRQKLVKQANEINMLIDAQKETPEQKAARIIAEIAARQEKV